MSESRFKRYTSDEVKMRAAPLAELVQRSGVKLMSAGGRQQKGNCPFHNENTPSFYVYSEGAQCKHHFHCFGCGAHGDAVDFVAQKQGVEPKEAFKQLKREAGLWEDNHSPDRVEAVKFEIAELRRVQEEQSEDNPPYDIVMPVPKDVRTNRLAALGDRQTAPIMRPKAEMGEKLRTQLPLDRLHQYRDWDGALLGYVVRTPPLFDKETGKSKKITPMVGWAANVVLSDGTGVLNEGWAFMSFPAMRAPFGAHLAGVAFQNAQQHGTRPKFVIVEGEKCQEEAAKVLAGHGITPIAWVGGAQQWHKTDWSRLAKADVWLWPDNDPEGRGCMANIAAALVAHGSTNLRWVEPPAGKPKGWDCADAIHDDKWDADRLKAAFRGALPWQLGEDFPAGLVAKPRQYSDEQPISNQLAYYLRKMDLWSDGRPLPEPVETFAKQSGLWRPGPGETVAVPPPTAQPPADRPPRLPDKDKDDDWGGPSIGPVVKDAGRYAGRMLDRLGIAPPAPARSPLRRRADVFRLGAELLSAVVEAVRIRPLAVA